MRYEVIHLKEHYSFLGNNNCDPTLTLYLQDNIASMNRQDQKRPAILVLPGGGYRNVSAREAEPIALHFLPEGYNAFVLNYSVAPNVFPTAIREVAAALELMHANADDWKIDKERIAIVGFSAGGHLVGHYSNCYNIPEVREVFPESKAVQAAVMCYPAVTGDERYGHMGCFRTLSGSPEVTEEIKEKFSLDRKVTENTPPTFLWHTRTDGGVNVMNTLLYAQALAIHGVPFSVHIYPAGAHGLATVDEQTCKELAPDAALAHEWLNEVKKWLKITL